MTTLALSELRRCSHIMLLFYCALSTLGCDTRPLAAPEAKPEAITKGYYIQKTAYDVDILFVIDNSLSMAPKQDNVRRNFPAFMNKLKNMRDGLPNVHIGVVTSDMGGGSCRPNRRPGAMSGRPGVTAGKSPTPLDCQGVREGNFIVALNKGTETNFDGDIADVFACIAAVGENGCGFEQSLLAPAVALGAFGPVSENDGFLRPDALLAVVLLTDEDDCSVPPDSTLFDSAQTTLDSPLGPYGNFRCNEFGHLCAKQAPPRRGTEPVELNVDECHSNEEGMLYPVTELADLLKGLKPDNPNRVFVAAITGKPTHYGVQFMPSQRTSTSELWPEIQPTCRNQNDEAVVAYPAVRIRDFVEQFGANGVMESICEDSFASALDRIAEELSRRLMASCLSKRPTSDVTCTVVDHVPTESGEVAQVVPQCNPADPMQADTSRTCWYLVANDQCATKLELKVNRATDVPVGTYSEMQCVACLSDQGDCL